MKRFEQAVLQVESYNMDVILQIFKRNINLGTPFFKSLMKKTSTTMDDLFRLVDKYSMLEDDVWAASQQVLVTNYLTNNVKAGSSTPSNQSRQSNRRQDNRQQQEVRLIPLSISYERLLQQIQDLLNFRWLEPIKTDPAKGDRNRKCFYHKDYEHTTKQYKSMHYLVEKLIKVGHFK